MNPRLNKLLRLSVTPSLWPVAVFGVVPALEHAIMFPGREYDTVVDVGANRGQFAAFASRRWPKARIICYEPLPNPRQKLERVLHAVALGRSEIRAYALGAQTGLRSVHIAARDDSSSLLEIGERQHQIFGTREAGQLETKVARLLDEDGLENVGRALLKIDVQGFEYEVITGAGERLDSFDTVYIEASFVELYRSQKLADEIIAYLRTRGFRETCRKVNYWEGDMPVQADFMFDRVS